MTYIQFKNGSFIKVLKKKQRFNSLLDDRQCNNLKIDFEQCYEEIRTRMQEYWQREYYNAFVDVSTIACGANHVEPTLSGEAINTRLTPHSWEGIWRKDLTVY